MFFRNGITKDLLDNCEVDLETLEELIKFKTDNIEKSLAYKYINSFLEHSINRYGFDVIKNCHFLINYKDSLIFDNTEPIVKLLYKKFKTPFINYYIEP